MNTRSLMQATQAQKQRVSRRKVQPRADRAKEERNRQKSVGGGLANELGVTQGQNGEQGNTVEPRNTRPLGKLTH
jgi:hypothetical protein